MTVQEMAEIYRMAGIGTQAERDALLQWQGPDPRGWILEDSGGTKKD